MAAAVQRFNVKLMLPMSSIHPTTPARDPLRPLRYLWRVPCVVLHVLAGIVLCIVITVAGRNPVARNGKEPWVHAATRIWSSVLLRIFGLRPVRFGTPLPDPVLFVANHTSWLDIMVLDSQRAVCFVAKAEIARWPLIGWMASVGGTLFHRRGNNHSLSSVMQLMVDRLRMGRSVGVFPEGGSGYNGVLKVFHARIFQAALDAGVQVQPVALCFTRHGRRIVDAGFREDESFFGNVLRVLGGPPMDIEVDFLEPVASTPDARRRMAEQSRARIAAALERRDA